MNSIEALKKPWLPIENVFRELFALLSPVMTDIANAFMEEYRAQGAVYGDTFDGMIRWLRDEQEIKEHEYRIDQIRQRQEWCRDLRKKHERTRTVKQRARYAG